MEAENAFKINFCDTNVKGTPRLMLYARCVWDVRQKFVRLVMVQDTFISHKLCFNTQKCALDNTKYVTMIQTPPLLISGNYWWDIFVPHRNRDTPNILFPHSVLTAPVWPSITAKGIKQLQGSWLEGRVQGYFVGMKGLLIRFLKICKIQA